jgi:hypothetical protein
MADFTKTTAPVVHTDDDLQVQIRRGFDAEGNPEAQAYVVVRDEDGTWFPLADVATLDVGALRTELRKIVKHALELVGFTQN